MPRYRLYCVSSPNISAILAAACRAFKTVVFVIDQLEAFMKAAKQTLLYNILDALQHSQVQVSAFVGVGVWISHFCSKLMSIDESQIERTEPEGYYSFRV